MTEIINKMTQILGHLNAINIHGKEDIIHMASAMGILEDVMKCIIDNQGDKDDELKKGK